MILLADAALGAHVAPAFGRSVEYPSIRRLRNGHLSTCMALDGDASTSVRHIEPVNFSPLVAIQAAFSSDSFGEFMAHMRTKQGDCVVLDLWPVAPKTYLLMGKEANKEVLSSLDPSLEQILQELINVLPVAAKVPSEVDVELQRKVASLFQSEKVVNARLPSFGTSAREMQERWASRPPGSDLNIFYELSEYVLLADLEVIYGRTFREAHSETIIKEFALWVDNLAKGASPIGFFKALGELLRGTIGELQARPELYRDERSVLSVYLESGALGRHDEEALVGLLSMTLMAAVFNTQVSLAWILVHLYGDDELLRRARDEIATITDLEDYAELERLPFLNSCIDEAVRLHTMLPGNTVLRKTKREIQLGSHTVDAGSVLWLYPNAVHLDEEYFPEPKAFCPMRLLNGNLEAKQSEFELVTFGHGQKRCIGEKMARAMILSFLARALPEIDADAPEELPEDGFFDLIPASELRLQNVRARGGSNPPNGIGAVSGDGAVISSVGATAAAGAVASPAVASLSERMAAARPSLSESWAADVAGTAADVAHILQTYAYPVARDAAKVRPRALPSKIPAHTQIQRILPSPGSHFQLFCARTGGRPGGARRALGAVARVMALVDDVGRVARAGCKSHLEGRQRRRRPCREHRRGAPLSRRPFGAAARRHRRVRRARRARFLDVGLLLMYMLSTIDWAF